MGIDHRGGRAEKKKKKESPREREMAGQEVKGRWPVLEVTRL